MKRLLLPLLAALALPTVVNAGVDPAVHNICKDVKDYMGCVKANSKEFLEEDKNAKRTFTRDDGKTVIFDPKSVVAQNVRGEYGRYIKFSYRLNYYRGSSYVPQTQITPDRVSTNTFGTINSFGGGASYSGTSYSTITPGATMGGFSIPGGMRSREWVVEVDCEDYTVNHVGDGGGWISFNRRLSEEGKTAKAIADEFCPQMDNLVLNAEKLIEKIEPKLEISKQESFEGGYSHHTEMTAKQKKYMEKDCQKSTSTKYRKEQFLRCRDSGLFDSSEYVWTGWRYKKRDDSYDINSEEKSDWKDYLLLDK